MVLALGLRWPQDAADRHTEGAEKRSAIFIGNMSQCCLVPKTWHMSEVHAKQTWNSLSLSPTQTRSPVHTHAPFTHARMRACMHARTHARTQARTHANTHARTQNTKWCRHCRGDLWKGLCYPCQSFHASLWHPDLLHWSKFETHQELQHKELKSFRFLKAPWDSLCLGYLLYSKWTRVILGQDCLRALCSEQFPPPSTLVEQGVFVNVLQWVWSG